MVRVNIRPVATAKNNLNYNPERLVSAAPVEDDSSFELKLRPQRLGEFIGQAKVKENLAVAIEAARSRGEAMDHVLLYGPPGLGKTTLANIIANELGVHFQPTAAPLLQIKGDLTAIITNMQERQVLFIDEIHRLQPVLEELLYSALDDPKSRSQRRRNQSRSRSCADKGERLHLQRVCPRRRPLSNNDVEFVILKRGI